MEIMRPVASPVVKQEITLLVGSPLPSGDHAWTVPLVLGGVTPMPTEGEKSKPGPVHAAGVKIQCAVLDDGANGSVLSVSVSHVECDGLPITPDSVHPQSLLGSIQVNLDAVLSNANVPRP